MSVVLIAFRRGHSTADIAHLLGVSEAEVVDELHRARSEERGWSQGQNSRLQVRQSRQAGEVIEGHERLEKDRSTDI